MAIVKASEAAARKASQAKVAATVKKAATTVKATAAKTAEKLTTIAKAGARRAETAPAATKVAIPAVKAPTAKAVVAPAKKAAPATIAAPAVKATAVKATAVKAPVVAGVVVSPNKGKVALPPAAPAAKKAKAPKEVKPSPRGMIVDMLLLRSMTDEEIHADVVKKYGEGLYTTTQSYVQLTRSDLNAGLIKKPIVDGRLTAHVGKVIIDEKGNRVEQPYKPSNLRKAELIFEVVA
jgi:hypothetical protein